MAGALDFLTVKGPEPASYTPPTVNSDWAGNLVNNYQQGEQYGRLRQLQNLFKPGSPGADAMARGDYSGVMQQLIQAGGAESASQMLPALVGAQTSQMIMGGGQGQLGGVGQQTQQQSAVPTGGADPRGKIPVIIAAAQKYGVDPATAIRVARSEGLASFYGDNGRSGGAFQLYTRGGLGNEFQKEMHLDPLDQKNEDATIDWAMKNVARTGWGPYKGAAKVGIGPRQGIGVQTAAATPGQSDKLNAKDAAAVKAMYPDTATPAVQQPPGATGTPPFLPKTDTEGTAAAATMPAAANNVATGPAGITGPPQQPAAAAPPTAPPPAQVAQAQPTAPPQAAPATGGGALLPGDSPAALANRQKADAYQMQQANALMANPMTKSAGEGMMERAKASMAITNAMQERLTKQQQMEYAAGLEPETAGRRQIAEAKGKRVGEVIEAGGKNARDTMNDLQTIEDAVRAGGDNIAYGPGAENWNKAKQFLNNIFPEAGLAEADTIIKMNARLAAAAAKSMTARPSQLEFKTFVANNPGIMNSKAGTIALINILKQSTQQSLDLGALASKVKNPDDWADQEETYYKTHKLMSPFTGKAMDEAPAVVPLPTVGDVVNGHRFKGGDPKSKASWEPVI